MSIALVAEFLPEFSPPGVKRRFEHVTGWLQQDDRNWVVHALHSGGPNFVSKLERVTSVLRVKEQLRRAVVQSEGVIVLGLGGAHMLRLAHLLALEFPDKTIMYDACDSWFLQIAARARTGSVRLCAPSLVGAAFQRFSTRRLNFVYISDRDYVADRLLTRGRNAHIVGPDLIPALEKLSAPSSRVTRIVVAADYNAFHNLDGLNRLFEAWPTFSSDYPSIRLELFGASIPRVLPDGNVLVRGWAEDIRDVYRGDTAVFIPNIGGSGIPNKLVEALSASRTVIAHDSMSWIFRGKQTVVAFGERPLLTALYKLIAAQPGSEMLVRREA